MRPSSNLGLRHLALRVRNIAAIRHFYVDLLGFGIERELPGEELWLTTGADSLVFLRDAHSGAVSGSFDHLGFIVPLSTDVAAWEHYLRANHVRILESTEEYDDGSVGLIGEDPEGHHVQVLWHPGVLRAMAKSGLAPQPAK